VNTNAYILAERFTGIKEIPGSLDNPQIMAMLKLDNEWPTGDEVPWCSAFTNYVCWLLRLPRSKSLMARSWLEVGRPVLLTEAKAGYDVVILSRGESPTAGHVGFYANHDKDSVFLLGGNQGDTVGVSKYTTSRILGVRRLYEDSSQHC